jgi:hypothetical protein
MNFVA